MAAKRKKTVAGATQDGLRATLEAMRDDLAAAMDVADPAVKAQLSGQLVRVLDRLDSLPSEERSPLDDAKDELAARRAAAVKGPATSAAQRKSRRRSSETG